MQLAAHLSEVLRAAPFFRHRLNTTCAPVCQTIYWDPVSPQGEVKFNLRSFFATQAKAVETPFAVLLDRFTPTTKRTRAGRRSWMAGDMAYWISLHFAVAALSRLWCWCDVVRVLATK